MQKVHSSVFQTSEHKFFLPQSLITIFGNTGDLTFPLPAFSHIQSFISAFHSHLYNSNLLKSTVFSAICIKQHLAPLIITISYFLT